MKAERARELAQGCFSGPSGSWSTPPLSQRIQQAILQACNEQKEADAKIAENMEPDDHGRLAVEDIALAIRVAE